MLVASFAVFSSVAEAPRLRNGLKKSREDFVQIDCELNASDPPPNSVADFTILSCRAYLDGLVTPVDEPDLLKAEREVRVALELSIIDPGRPAENLNREPVFGDLAPIGCRLEARGIHEDVGL